MSDSNTQTRALDPWLQSLNQVAAEPNSPPWVGAHRQGVAAVRPLADLMESEEPEVARNAKRALYDIVRHASAPGANKERLRIEAQLITLLKSNKSATRQDFIWMLSEIGGAESAEALQGLLANPATREDARCALQRIPHRKAVSVLKRAFDSAPEEFKYALAESLRNRGEKVRGYPSRKLVPNVPA